MSNLIQRAAQALHAARLVAVLTGAGISKESGIPTFRDAMDGLWAKFDPMQLATPHAFQANPKLVWDWYEHRRHMVKDVQPNLGHYALVELEQLVPQVVILTQNVDGLHYKAGSTDVLALHGDITQHKCFNNCRGNPTLINVDNLAFDAEHGPPACPYCGAYVRPNVVWFTELLPPQAIDRAIETAEQCSVMLVVGTSGLVQPAAQLPYYAKQHGAVIIDVNPMQDEISALADIYLQGPAGQVLPQIVQATRALHQ